MMIERSSNRRRLEPLEAAEDRYDAVMRNPAIYLGRAVSGRGRVLPSRVLRPHGPGHCDQGMGHTASDTGLIQGPVPP